MRDFILLGAVLALTPGCGSDSKDDSGAGGSAGTEPLAERYELSDDVGVPEGIAFDPTDRVFYLSSLVDGRITRVDAAGVETLLRDPSEGTATSGLAVDVERRRLWACAERSLRAFELPGGAELVTHDLTQLDADASCNDVTVLSDGRAYATDSTKGNIYTATVEGAVSVHFNDPSLGGVLGANGVVATPDEETLIVAVFLDRSLARVAVDSPSSLSPVELEGDPLGTPDGLVWHDAAVYSVSDNVVQRVGFAAGADGTGSVTSTSDVPSGLSTGALAEGRLFVVKSEVTNHVLNGQLDLPFEIVEVDLDSF